jgi:hypothetical protein
MVLCGRVRARTDFVETRRMKERTGEPPLEDRHESSGLRNSWGLSTVCNVGNISIGSISLPLRRVVPLMKHAAMHRVEDRIRSLCARMVTVEGDEEITLHLKDSLHEYIERLCIRMADCSFVVERRRLMECSPMSQREIKRVKSILTFSRTRSHCGYCPLH